MEWYWWLILFLAFWLVVNHYKTKWKRKQLMEKYNDKALVDKLMNRMFWQGQSKEQLLDSLGKPLDIDQKVLKTKTKETWKYNATGKNRYGLKIVLEDGQVVGWDKK